MHGGCDFLLVASSLQVAVWRDSKRKRVVVSFRGTERVTGQTGRQAGGRVGRRAGGRAGRQAGSHGGRQGGRRVEQPVTWEEHDARLKIQ